MAFFTCKVRLPLVKTIMLTNCKNKAIKLCFTVENKKYCTVGTAPKYNRKNVSTLFNRCTKVL